MDKKNENKIYYLEVLEKGYLELLNFVAKQDKIPIFIQNVILYELFGKYKKWLIILKNYLL
ncbi:hypothetical protein OLQ14_09050 [Campylobacter jejuni]|nr:hypothetical protein [Campylobacter jejuni]